MADWNDHSLIFEKGVYPTIVINQQTTLAYGTDTLPRIKSSPWILQRRTAE